ncbi:MAG: AAC(3) family N-acetyltransferase [Synergistaceae bacterium]|jgi:aminoglycoside 3-N-acetyltransferase|nr:AAC(3) family N-acetyltransferase [Synergistaceae bacterium]
MAAPAVLAVLPVSPETGIVRLEDKLYKAVHLRECLDEIGVSRGDHIVVHSRMIAFGLPVFKATEAGLAQFLNAFIGVLSSAVGPEGVLLMPAFTYSFCKGEPYDVQNTPSTVGSLTERFRQDAGVRRTRDPIFSFAVSGGGDYLDISDSCFGENSVFDKLYANGGKILFLGTDMGSATYIHYVEKKFGVPYRYDKIFGGTTIENGVARDASCTYFVRRLGEKSVFSPEALRKMLEESGNYNVSQFGAGKITCVDARRCADSVIERLEKNPLCLLG